MNNILYLRTINICIMEQTLFIVLAVVIVFALLYRWKKRKENKMGNKLNALIEANDWRGVCRILRKQLILWGVLLVWFIALLVARIVLGGQMYTPVIVCAFLAWRFFKLVRLYRISRQNMRIVESEADTQQQMPIEDFMQGCRVTRMDVPSAELRQQWLDAYERGRQEGFCPVLLEVDGCFYDSLDDQSGWGDRAKFAEWQSAMLASDHSGGQDFLRKRFESVREDYGDDGEWQEKVVGTDDDINPVHDFGISDGSTVYLVEVPVTEPWQVFAYIPMGDWNSCPRAEEHMAVAKYWYEKYGAVVAHISNDMIQYYLPQPVTGDTMPLAEEHMGYCDDTVYQGESLTSLAAELRKSSVWCFWWD